MNNYPPPPHTPIEALIFAGKIQILPRAHAIKLNIQLPKKFSAQNFDPRKSIWAQYFYISSTLSASVQSNPRLVHQKFLPLQPTYLENWLCFTTKPSNLMGNLTSQLPTIFCILNSMNRAWTQSVKWAPSHDFKTQACLLRRVLAL